MRFLEKWRGNGSKQGLKERILKNREGVLDAMAENIKGARQCPFLLGNKCLGIMCEHFMEFKNVDDKTGKEMSFGRCAFVQMPLLLIELRESIEKLTAKIKE